VSDTTLAHYVETLRFDFSAFTERSFAEVRPAEPFEFNWHIEVLAEKLERVRLGKTTRLIINLPPRHLKSFVGSVAFPAFVLGHKPSTEILCVSYGQDLADEFSRLCLGLMRSPFYRAVFKTRLDPTRQAVEEYKTVAGGCRRATSLTGGLTGRGADIIIIDDPIKADDSQSDVRRASVNTSFYNTIYSRLNNKTTSAIVIIMQRLHADDLVAYVQEREAWEVVAFPAIAEERRVYDVRTPYGRRRIIREAGDALQPARESLASLEETRGRDEYVFAAQYQQDPQPPAGLIVRREWLHFYSDKTKPIKFDQIIQSWDTANKATELSNFSVCTTWGIKEGRLYLLDVLRRKMEFPELKRTVREWANQWRAEIVLVEDKASGTQLIQDLRVEDFSIVQAAPALDGDKEIRLRAQTAKIEGGFALFPEKAPWLDAYLLELTGFPNSKYDDQVDSTVNALAWLTQRTTMSGWGWLEYMRRELADQSGTSVEKTRMVRVRMPPGSSLWSLITGRWVAIPEDRIIEVTQEELTSVLRNGGQRVE
jgi:predicted phage terminase large subunit-like protein